MAEVGRCADLARAANLVLGSISRSVILDSPPLTPLRNEQSPRNPPYEPGSGQRVGLANSSRLCTQVDVAGFSVLLPPSSSALVTAGGVEGLLLRAGLSRERLMNQMTQMPTASIPALDAAATYA